jgi:hypothetical protein
METTHCKHHGLKLEKKTYNQTKRTSWFLRIAFFIKSPSKYTKSGSERKFLVCPKGDYATEA